MLFSDRCDVSCISRYDLVEPVPSLRYGLQQSGSSFAPDRLCGCYPVITPENLSFANR